MPKEKKSPVIRAINKEIAVLQKKLAEIEELCKFNTHKELFELQRSVIKQAESNEAY